jgi:hypothetical protein
MHAEKEAQGFLGVSSDQPNPGAALKKLSAEYLNLLSEKA